MRIAEGAPRECGGVRDLTYRLDRLTTNQPPEERRTIAIAGVGLLAVGIMVLVNAGAEPPGRIAVVALRALCVGGVGWLCCRGVAPAEQAVHPTSAMS